MEAQHGLGVDYPKAPKASLWRSSLSLTLTENIYDNGRTTLKYRNALEQQRLAGLRLEQGRQDALLELIESYLNYALTEHLLTTNSELKSNLDRQFKLTESQYRQGLKTRKDYLRFRGDVQRAEMEQIELGNRRNLALRRIALLIGYEDDEAPQIKVFNPRTESLPPLPNQQIDERRLIEEKIFTAEQRLQDNDIELIKKNNLPQFDLLSEASYGSSNYMGTGTSAAENDKLSWSIMLSVKYNILDFGARHHETLTALNKKSVAELNFAERKIKINQDIEKLFADLKITEHNIKLSRELYNLEQESLKLLKDEFREGRVNYIDLVQALQNVTSAQRGFYNNTFTYLGLLAKLAHYEGRLESFNF